LAERAIQIRRAAEADQPAVAELAEALAKMHARLQPGFFRADGAAATRAFRRQLADVHALTLVAERAGRLVGLACASLQRTPPAPELRARLRLYLETLFVAASARRAGVGRRLVAAVEEWGRERGAEQVVLTAWAGNRAAERFYRALGYAVAGRILAREIA
jgi:GNAT superfamily N-acetyltransferase